MLPPTQTPNPSQWNIGGIKSSGVGSSDVGARIQHVHFMLFVSISLLALGTQHKRVFSGIWA